MIKTDTTKKLKSLTEHDNFFYAIVVNNSTRKIKIYDMARGIGVESLPEYTIIGVEQDLLDAYRTLKRWSFPWNKFRLWLFVTSVNAMKKEFAAARMLESFLVHKGMRNADLTYSEIRKKPKEKMVIKSIFS